jgi:CRISPR/Cas system endoribonuclease Cas6 (RAMP superfamily)
MLAIDEYMTNVEKLEREIANLSREELAEFRRWYAKFDVAVWDRQLEADIQPGPLDRLAEEAQAEHRAGRSRPVCPTMRQHASP